MLSGTVAANTGHYEAGQNSTKYGLSMALKTIANKHQSDADLYNSLVELNRRVWESKSYNELTTIIRETDRAFQMIA